MATFGFEVLKNSFLVFVNTKEKKERKKRQMGTGKGFSNIFLKHLLTDKHQQDNLF